MNRKVAWFFSVLGILFLTFCEPGNAFAAIVFDDFGPSDLYSNTSGIGIGGAYGNEFAMPFTPSSSGYFSEIYTSAFLPDTPSATPLTISLFSDNSGEPGSALEDVALVVPVGNTIANAPRSPIMGTALGTTYLDNSLTYWLVASGPTAASIGLDYSALGLFGLSGTRDNTDPTWLLGDRYLAVYRVVVTETPSTVPIPGALALFASGLAGIGFARRKVAKN
jgi:hypothetical protein